MNHKILIVDDDDRSRELVHDQLVALGFREILHAQTGREALTALKENSVDLVISDWRMPGMSGLDFFHEVRQNEEWQEIPFLMLTAVRDKEKIVEAMTGGVKNYIIKPYDLETLEQKVRRVLKLGP